MSSETEVVAHLSHSSLHPELSQFIVFKLIWPSSDAFQYVIVSLHPQTPHRVCSVGSTAVRAPIFAANFECVLRTSLIGVEAHFFRAMSYSGVFVERPRSLEQQSAFAVNCLLENKIDLSHLNDGTATVRVSHYTQCIAA